MINQPQDEIMKDWPQAWDTPMVSIRCTAYNHEPYIVQTLDGFLMQKTSFPFEVVVHDDASTDKTADIIREYELKYPKIIKPIYETENQYSKHDGSLRKIMDAACRGEYIAFCEGDDYWTDPLKLKKQVDVMEKNANVSVCGGGFAVKRNAEENDYTVYADKNISFSFEAWRNKWFMKTLTVMYRRQIMDVLQEKNYNYAKDTTVQYHALKLGMGVYIPEKFGVYNAHGGGVWSGSNDYKRIKWEYLSLREIYEKNDFDKIVSSHYCNWLAKLITCTDSLGEKIKLLKEGLMIRGALKAKLKLFFCFFVKHKFI